jgi:L-aminopeptidase/D-esterase-like protein
LIDGTGGSGDVGVGPIRTGSLPFCRAVAAHAAATVLAGYFSGTAAGLTGCHWVDESGRCDGPICITNTHSCGTVRDATIRWLVTRGSGIGQWILPVTGETFDGYLNDINGFHVRDEHVFAALDGAHGGAIEEGSVGGGTA